MAMSTKSRSMSAKQNSVAFNTVTIKKMQMTRSSGDKMGIMKSLMKLMKKQQNMTKLRHEECSDKSQTFINSNLPKESTMKIRMCLDISSYKKQDPPLD